MATVIITNDGWHSRDYIDRAVRECEQFVEADSHKKKCIASRNCLTHYCQQLCSTLYSRQHVGNQLSEEARLIRVVQEKLRDTIAWLSETERGVSETEGEIHADSADEFELVRREMQALCDPIVSQMGCSQGSSNTTGADTCEGTVPALELEYRNLADLSDAQLRQLALEVQEEERRRAQVTKGQPSGVASERSTVAAFYASMQNCKTLAVLQNFPSGSTGGDSPCGLSQDGIERAVLEAEPHSLGHDDSGVPFVDCGSVEIDEVD